MGIVLTKGKTSEYGTRCANNKHLVFVVNLLAMNKKGIANVIRDNEECRTTFFDRDK